MRDRTTSTVAAVPTFRITSASAGLISSHSSSSFRRGSIQVRIATFGAGLFASEGSWCIAVLRFTAIARSIMLIWILLNRVAGPESGLRQRFVDVSYTDQTDRCGLRALLSKLRRG